MTQLSSSRTQCNGFSLLELLTVCSVIGVLLLLGLRLSGDLRRSSQQAQCINQLKAIAAATLSYAEDHHGALPGPVTSGQRPFVTNSTIKLAHRSSLGDFLYSYLGHPEPSSAQMEISALICPAARAAQHKRSLPVFEGRYYVSTAHHSGNIASFPFGYRSGSEWIAPKRLVELKNPASTILLFDMDAALFALRGLHLSEPPTHPVHGEIRNALYADGHVEAITVSRFRWNLSPLQMIID